MSNRTITIGTRGSDLALWQAHFVKNQLVGLGHEVSIKIIKTQGDRIQHLSFDKLEGKGFFTKELEDQLLSGQVDLAVHSHKDLETSQPEGLTIAAVSYRENPSDLLLIRKEAADETLELGFKQNAIVGTSSARRKAQLLSKRKDINLKDIRGNVPTRIDKLRSGAFDVIMLAAAGIQRLNLDVSDLVSVELDPVSFIPAPAQGVLGLQIREDDTDLHGILSSVNHSDVQACIQAEREVLRKLNGGCQLPFGAYCTEESGTYKLSVALGSENLLETQYFTFESTDPKELSENAFNALTV
jgi:hydroxymethylbilane synthase